MSWRPLEQELIDIIRRDGFEVVPDHNTGDHYLDIYGPDDGLNITELAKELMRRGVGIGTPQ